MVRSVGIDPGDHAVKVVEIDGNYRKTRLLKVHTQALDDPAGRAAQVAAAARAALDSGMRGEILLGHPCREAVQRVIELPFKGRDAIRKVVKAEVEGEIHSHVVDDMVVDFHELGSGAEGGSRVLVVAVPKDGLRTSIQALSGKGIEPEVVDLDTMALYRAAHWAGAFEAAPGAVATAATAAPWTAVVDVGARSVKVLLVQGEQLLEMRALRLGPATVVDDVARRHGLPYLKARDVVADVLQRGSDQMITVDEALPATEGAKEAPAEPSRQRQVKVTHAEVEAAQAAFLQRLSRELVRYLTSSGKVAQVSAVWCTGGGCRQPGLREVLADAFGQEPRELDVLGKLQHDLDPATAADCATTLTTALGLALLKLGGPAGFDLRQEDLAFTRGFERIKFPLAIACMLGLLALFVHGNLRSHELKLMELQIGRTFVDPKNPKAPPQFYGMLHALLSSKWFESPQQFRIEQGRGKDYLYKDLVAELANAPVHRRLPLLRDKLKKVAEDKQKESGVFEDVTLESGLAVLVRFAEVLKAIEPQLGRYLLLKLALNMGGQSRSLEFVVAFRGDDFRDRLAVLENALDAEYTKADSPFEQGKGRESRSKEDLFRSDGSTRGSYYTFKLRIKDSFVPYGPSAPGAVGALETGPRLPANPAVAAPRTDDRLATAPEVK